MFSSIIYIDFITLDKVLKKRGRYLEDLRIPDIKATEKIDVQKFRLKDIFRIIKQFTLTLTIY